MKKLMNDPKEFVPEMMKGIEAANPGKIKWVPEYNLVMRADAPNPNKVSIVQGSGSGHEPAHIMVVGKGMLDGACPGDVFAAPPMGNVVESSKLLASPKGILHIVNNYSGDRMSFETAAEMLDAEDVLVKTIYVDDDVAVQDSTYTVGRRGVAGNFFVIKAVGAASEEGASLDELVELGNKVNSMTRSMGMALTGCTPPAKGQPIFTLEEDEIEMGVGIHGEPGRARKKLASANEIVAEMVEAILTDRKPIFDEDGNRTGTDDAVFNSGDEVALMVNGLGGTPISELYIVYGIAHDLLADRGINVWRSYVGEYCTSLEMAGMSITLAKVDDQLKELYMAPAEIPIRVF
jgi:phosphoenolpyruvate---glycerone phosphotransferase subunit DhaK